MYNVPSNLILIKLPIQNIRERASKLIYETYGKVIQPENLIQQNYKLVDFKIVFPKLFDDIIQQYNITDKDYVGWGDCDLIYGKFSNFIDFSKNYEILGGWHGHFTAIKNTESFKNNFKTIPNYLELITDNSLTFVTDEIAYRKPLIKYLDENKFKMFYANSYFCDIVPPIFFNKFRPNHKDFKNNFFDVYNTDKNISYLFFDKTNKNLSVKYENNEYMKEVLYCHLQKRKMTLPFTYYETGYYIHENSFSINIDE
jgi:hypothetical protein